MLRGSGSSVKGFDAFDAYSMSIGAILDTEEGIGITAEDTIAGTEFCCSGSIEGNFVGVFGSEGYGDITTADFSFIELDDSEVGFFFSTHFHKGESTGSAGVSIGGDMDVGDRSY